MTTAPAKPRPRRTPLDRFAHWALDLDGDIYGDERERLRWYEGIAVVATLQWIGVPVAAAVLVWTLGRPAVLPLAVMAVVMYLPTLLLGVYVRSRRVSATVRTWNGKAMLSAALFAVPYLVFLVGCFAAYADPATAQGAAVGALLGGAVGIVLLVLATRRRRRREAMPVSDVD